MRMYMANKLGGTVSLLAALLIICTGCSLSGKSSTPVISPTADAATPPPAAATAPPAPEVLSIGVALDPSLMASDISDPYAEMNRYAREAYKPEKELYNLLYRAVDEMAPSVDVSAFSPTAFQIAQMKDCLYCEAQFRFYYFKDVKLSRDGKKALLTYTTGNKEETGRNKETLCARLSHLVYNVAPEGYTDMQKALAVYQYLCEQSDYSADATVPSTWTPYSILMDSQGICNGYAGLADYVLNRAGVPTEYVSSAPSPHAWNIVTIGGKQYHFDSTFGVGQAGIMNSLSTVFMDDATRSQTLRNAGLNVDTFILGYDNTASASAPSCTDTGLAAYNSILNYYALDIDGGKVYFAGDGKELKSMNLDCTGLESISTEVSPSVMAAYDGALYFAGSEDGRLYKYVPGGKPEIFGDAQFVTYIAAVGGMLRYSEIATGTDYKTIPLTDFDASQWTNANTLSLPAAGAPRSRSFAAKITFSEPMDAKARWQDFVYMADSDGNPLGLHFLWSDDGKTLTVRPRECVADMGSVTVYVKSGASAANGEALAKGYTAKVDITAGK